MACPVEAKLFNRGLPRCSKGALQGGLLAPCKQLVLLAICNVSFLLHCGEMLLAPLAICNQAVLLHRGGVCKLLHEGAISAGSYSTGWSHVCSLSAFHFDLYP